MSEDKLDKVIELMATQAQNKEPVSKAVNNPMMWVSFVGVLFAIIGTLALFIYNAQQAQRDKDFKEYKELKEKEFNEYKAGVAIKDAKTATFFSSPRFAEDLYIGKYHTGIISKIDNNENGVANLRGEVKDIDDKVDDIGYDVKYIKSQFENKDDE